MRFTILIATVILSMTGFAVCKAHGSSHDHNSPSASSFQTSMKGHATKSSEALKESKTYIANLTLYTVVTRHDGHRPHRVPKKLDVLSRRIEKQLPSLILDSERWKVAYESGPPKLMIPALCGLMTSMELEKKTYLKDAAAWNKTIESLTKGKDGEKTRIEIMPVMISWPTTATLKQCKLA